MKYTQRLPKLSVLYSVFRSTRETSFPRPPKPGGYRDSSEDLSGAWSKLCWDHSDRSVCSSDKLDSISAIDKDSILWANTPLATDHPLYLSDGKACVIGHPPESHELLDNKGATSCLLRYQHSRFVSGSLLWASESGLNRAIAAAAPTREANLGYLDTHAVLGPTVQCGVLPIESKDDSSAVAACLRKWNIELPVVGKPVAGRGSEGVAVLETEEQLADHCRRIASTMLNAPNTGSDSSDNRALRYGEAILVEQMLPGQELTIAVMPPGLYWLPWPQLTPRTSQSMESVDNNHGDPRTLRSAAWTDYWWWMHPASQAAVQPHQHTEVLAGLSARAYAEALQAVQAATSETAGVRAVMDAINRDEQRIKAGHGGSVELFGTAADAAAALYSVSFWGEQATGLTTLAAFLRGQDPRWSAQQHEVTREQPVERGASGGIGHGLALVSLSRHWALPPILRGGPAVVTSGEQPRGCDDTFRGSVMPYNGTVPVTANSRSLTAAEAEDCMMGNDGTAQENSDSSGSSSYDCRADGPGGWLGTAMRDCEDVARLAGATAPIRIDCRGTRASTSSAKASQPAISSTAESNWPYPTDPHGGGMIGRAFVAEDPIALFDVNAKPNATGPRGQIGRDGPTPAGLLAMAAAAPPIGWTYEQFVLNTAMQALPMARLNSMGPEELYRDGVVDSSTGRH